ncbi:hypothetical protein NDU88_000100 [Pleurodeles waltl]|uniref:Uncharacterized protein n=1 Tax=Pleurodeles waltl TaxID=8319 RepID=A0AAV7KNJ6_PLEWA|nr:hypothetical protein NDU88_000100 [Pleurodeles waltl]
MRSQTLTDTLPLTLAWVGGLERHASRHGRTLWASATRGVAFLEPTTDSVHPSVCSSPHRDADRPDMAPSGRTPGLDIGPDSHPWYL